MYLLWKWQIQYLVLDLVYTCTTRNMQLITKILNLNLDLKNSHTSPTFWCFDFSNLPLILSHFMAQCMSFEIVLFPSFFYPLFTWYTWILVTIRYRVQITSGVKPILIYILGEWKKCNSNWGAILIDLKTFWKLRGWYK